LNSGTKDNIFEEAFNEFIKEKYPKISKIRTHTWI